MKASIKYQSMILPYVATPDTSLGDTCINTPILVVQHNAIFRFHLHEPIIPAIIVNRWSYKVALILVGCRMALGECCGPRSKDLLSIPTRGAPCVLVQDVHPTRIPWYSPTLDAEYTWSQTTEIVSPTGVASATEINLDKRYLFTTELAFNAANEPIVR